MTLAAAAVAAAAGAACRYGPWNSGEPHELLAGLSASSGSHGECAVPMPVVVGEATAAEVALQPCMGCDCGVAVGAPAGSGEWGIWWC